MASMAVIIARGRNVDLVMVQVVVLKYRIPRCLRAGKCPKIPICYSYTAILLGHKASGGILCCVLFTQ